MRRTLWAMSDDEVYVLREKARKLLRELYLEYEEWQAYATLTEQKRDAWKRQTPEFRKLDIRARNAWHHVELVEERLAAQRQFVTSLDNEFAHRNPPFWSRQDLEDMDYWRSHS